MSERTGDPRIDVTVVIPTRDRWELLSTSALPSALAQEHVVHEVVVVDDGSRDSTPEQLAALAEPRLRVVVHESARGVAHARNAGIAASRGEWVAFLDDDDLWSPDKLRTQLDAAETEGAEVVYTGAAWLDEDRRYVRALPPPEPAGLATELLRWNVMWAGASNVTVRRDLVLRVGSFDERLFQLADWDLWIRLALAGRLASCSELLVGYVMQPASMLLTDRRDVFVEFEYLRAKHADAARAHGVKLDAAKFSRWVALGHLRGGRRRRAAREYLRGAARYGDAGALVRSGAALFGPRAIPVGRSLLARLRRADPDPVGEEPDWLRRYGVSTSTAAE